jgi:hypothetical protein
MLQFQTYLPRDDTVLCTKLAQFSSPLSIEFHQGNTTLKELKRLFMHAHATERRVKRVRVPVLSFLRAYEKPPFLLDSELPAEILNEFQELDITVKYQPLTFKQMEFFSIFLGNSRDLKRITLSLFEYPTEEFLETERFKALEPPGSLLCSLPAILAMQTATERKQQTDEEDARSIATMLVDSILGRKAIEIGPHLTTMEARIASTLAAAAAPISITSPESPRELPPTSTSISRATPAGLECAPAARAPELKHMTRAESDAVLSSLLAAPLPPSLEDARLHLLMPTAPPTAFLAHLPRLSSLSLAYCHLTDDALAILAPPIAALPALRRLSLARNALALADLAPLAAAPALAALDLSFNPLRGPAAASLFAALRGRASPADVDLSHTALRSPGLRLDGLAGWRAAAARLALPAVFSESEVRAIEAALPDRATLILDGPAFAGGGGGGDGGGPPPADRLLH